MIHIRCNSDEGDTKQRSALLASECCEKGEREREDGTRLTIEEECLSPAMW